MGNEILNQVNGFNVSPRYSVVTTRGLVDYLQNAGFEVSKMTTARVKNPAKQGFQKHVLRVRHPDFVKNCPSDIIPEIIIKNSYDGTSSLEVMLGVYRIACANGLIIGTTFASVRIRHVGDNLLSKIIPAVDEIIKQYPRVLEVIARMKAIDLDLNKSLAFAAQAAPIFMPPNSAYNAQSLVRVRRFDDRSTDLWTVFNRIQESAMKGGIRYVTQVEQNGLGVPQRTRAIRSIDRTVQVNRELWSLAEEMMAA